MNQDKLVIFTGKFILQSYYSKTGKQFSLLKNDMTFRVRLGSLFTLSKYKQDFPEVFGCICRRNKS